MKHVLVLGTSLLSGALALSTPVSPSAPDEDTRALFAAALELELLEVQAADPLDETLLGAVAKACGSETTALAEATVWNGLLLHMDPEREVDVRVARVPIPGDGAPGSVLFMLEERAFAGAAVLDAEGAPVEEWKHFLEGFQFYEVPRLASARPRSFLAEERARLAAAKDDDARLALALLDVLQHMNAQATPFNLPPGTSDSTPVEDAEMMSVEYAAIAELADSLAPLLGDQAGTFAEIALDSSERALELAESARSGDEEAGRGPQRKIFANCNACHRLNLPEQDGKVKDVFFDARVDLGIGDGFYQLGHDVRIRHPDRERAQAVSDALRAGALLIDASR